MNCYQLGEGKMIVDFESGVITSVRYAGVELIAETVPLFTVCMRDVDGKEHFLNSTEAKKVQLTENGAVFDGFAYDLSVRVSVATDVSGIDWGIGIENHTEKLVEWVEYPSLCVKPLIKNGGIGQMLYPYNEGALVDDAERRDRSWFPSSEPSYPSRGSYTVFPNMLCSQFMCYLFEGHGLYIGAHDVKRGIKSFDFTSHGKGLSLRQRLYSGVNDGEDFAIDYPLRWCFFDGDWQDGADIYHAFVEAHLPEEMKKITENDALPKWYKDSPLIVAYPVRGVHDMDEMKPNRLYPYENALPHLDEIAERTGSRVMALLMHWEGTAPWAPPYVMPPYGGQEEFDAFRDALHARGQLLGVYCSGFGYTLQSNLIDECRSEISEEAAKRAMCTGYDGRVEISNICTSQRKGYDICPASEDGKHLLMDAYMPLFGSGVDYAQILDQNHGGSQYFCHSRIHGHPTAPGAWMTESMQDLLGEWNRKAGKMLFGCESAAAEPFIGNLLFSDNRYELNYRIGKPVPLYAYLYHEYVRNFMGNQVCCPLCPEVDSLPMRLSYSFVCGDSMTLVMGQDGEFLSAWGQRDFSKLPNRDNALTLIHNLTALYQSGAARFLYAGRMRKSPAVECDCISFPCEDGAVLDLPSVFVSAWEKDGTHALIFVNHTPEDVTCRVSGREITIPALDGVMEIQ